MMKKNVPLLLLSLLLCCFVACSDDEKEEIEQETELNVSYQVDAAGMSPIFNADITYKDETGNDISVGNVTLPWSKAIVVTAPFKASLAVKYVLIENAEIPETVNVGKNLSIVIDKGLKSSSSSMTIAKDQFDMWLESSASSTLEYELTVDTE